MNLIIEVVVTDRFHGISVAVDEQAIDRLSSAVKAGAWFTHRLHAVKVMSCFPYNFYVLTT